MKDANSTSVERDWPEWEPITPGRTTGYAGLPVGISVLALVVSLVTLVKVFSSEPPAVAQKPSSTTASSPPPGLHAVTGPATLAVGKDKALDLDALPRGDPGAPDKTTDLTFFVQPKAGPTAQDTFLLRFADDTEAEAQQGQSRCLATNGNPPALACVVVLDVNPGAVQLKVTTWRFG